MKDDTTQTEQTPPANEDRAGKPGTPYLVVLVGARAGEMFRLVKPATLLGRSQYADVRLVDDGVSRRHAALISNGGSVTLRDLKSANGTYCNGTRIVEPVQLADGDKISMGGTTILKFTYQDELEEQFNRQLTNRPSGTASPAFTIEDISTSGWMRRWRLRFGTRPRSP